MDDDTCALLGSFCCFACFAFLLPSVALGVTRAPRTQGAQTSSDRPGSETSLHVFGVKIVLSIHDARAAPSVRSLSCAARHDNFAHATFLFQARGHGYI